jgi:nucleoid-associated protein YgaU
MADEQTRGGLLDGVINAVTGRDEVAAAKAAKKEAEDARAQANQELAKRQEAEARANQAEADLGTARAQVDQETTARLRAEARAQEAEAKVTELQAEVARLKQELEEAKVRTYVVQSGDSLSQIAKQLYGDAKRWPEIYEANKDKIKDPNLIHPGQELRIP